MVILVVDVVVVFIVVVDVVVVVVVVVLIVLVVVLVVVVVVVVLFVSAYFALGVSAIWVAVCEAAGGLLSRGFVFLLHWYAVSVVLSGGDD